MTVSLGWVLRLVRPPCSCSILEQTPIECPWGPNDYETHLFTARNEVGARLCFYTCLWFCSQGGVCLSVCWDTHPPGKADPPLRSACWEIRWTSGRYASYWNAIHVVHYVSHSTQIGGFDSPTVRDPIRLITFRGCISCAWGRYN